MAWIDMWSGAWSSMWGMDLSDPQEMGNYYNIQVEIYADTAFGTLKDIINARYEPTTLSELKGHGAGSFKVSKRDPKIAKNPLLLEYRNYVKIRLNGTVVGGFIIQTKKTTIIGIGEERDEAWEVSGEGPKSWFRDASVFPPLGLKSSSAETRYFNFSTERGSWYNSADWSFASMRWAWNNVANGAPKGHSPANWPDAAGARWIWNTTSTSGDPEGFCYFRHEFTAPGTTGQKTSYAFFIAADNAAEIYVDGEQKAIIEVPGWYETTRVEMELEAGPHVIGVKAFNAHPGSPGEILTSLFTYGNPATPSAAVLVNHSGMANTWRVNGYPAQEPGWTVGDVLLTLLSEAEDRGVRFASNFTPTFSSQFDSSGVEWADTVPWSFEVGATYEDVISAVEELGCDVWVDPDTLELHVWNKRGADRSLQGLLKGPLVEARRNINLNPKVYPTTTNWITNPAFATITPTSTGARIDTTATTTETALFYHSTNITSEISVGDLWSASIEVEVPVGFPAVTLNLRNYSYGQNAIVAASGPVVVQPGTVVTLKANASAPITSATTGMRTILYGSGTASGARFIVRNVLTEKASVPGEYYDGSTVPKPGEIAIYRWASAPGASASIMEVPSQFGNVVVFSPGHNLVAAEETGQAEIANTLMLRTPEGWSEVSASDSTSVEKYGRVETQMSTKLTSSGASNLVQELFRQKALPEISATFEIVPVAGMIPFIDFNVGDWVSAPGEVPGVKESRRVMSISFTEDASTGLPVYALEFDTIFKDRQTELEKWLSRISNSSAISGGFTNSNSLPTTVVTAPPGNPTGIIPDAPTGLVVSSVGKYQPDGVSSSDYGLTWNAVLTGVGYGSVEIAHYEVWGRLSTETESQHMVSVFDTMAYLPGFRPGDIWVFKVRGVTRRGDAGNFSDEIALEAEAPQVPLPQPSTPELTSAFGVVTIEWDGLLGGNPAPPYVRYVRVERSPAGANTWSSVGTLTNYAVQDVPGNAGVSYDYRLVAVDAYGNESTPSNIATITVQGINSGDISGGLASNNLVANGSFEEGFSSTWEIITQPDGATAIVVDGGISGAKYLKMERIVEVGEDTELSVGQSAINYIPVSSVGEFGYFISAKASSSESSTSGNFTVRAYWYLEDKTTPASEPFSTAINSVGLTNLAAYFAGRVFPPEDAKFMQIVLVNDLPEKIVYADDVVAREAITSNMIGENVLLAEHFSSGSVTTNALQANSVTTDILDVEAVRADNIAVGEIQVSHLSPSVGDSLDISSNSSVNILINRTDDLETSLDNTNQTVAELTTYYSFGPDGAIIGQTNSAFKLALKNDRIEILENGVVVSYWDSGQMVVGSFVGEEVVLGNHKLEKYTTGTVVRAI